jgi:hypothetical protein
MIHRPTTPASTSAPVNRVALRFRLARLAAALGVVSLVWACNAPFIPVQPPGEASFKSEVFTDGEGAQHTLWTASGPANGNAALARFFVFDVDRNAGVIAGANADGSYLAPPFEGMSGDHVHIFFETQQGERSPTACLLLSTGSQAPRCP